MEEIEIFLRLGFMGLASILTVLTFISWHQTRETKLFLATAGFGIFMVEGLLLALGIFNGDIEALNTITMFVGLNFLALCFVYLSIIKR